MNMRRFTSLATYFLILACGSLAQAPASFGPDQKTKTRLQGIVAGILVQWEKHDVVCLGEDHGSRNDSDLRISLVENAAFAKKVQTVIIESADARRQKELDRFALDLEEMSRDQLRVAWKDAGGNEVWESPIYETFLRAIQKVNRTFSRDKRVRIIAGTDASIPNRGRYIREAVDREILSRGLKALAVYGARHCENRGGGFPGELGDKYPGKIWSAFQFHGVDEGRRVFNLGDQPQLIAVTGTERAKLPVGKMFFLGRHNDLATLGYMADAIVYFGNIADTIVPATKP
jgi:hypothetical protein